MYKDARDAILYEEGVRGPNFEILYKPIFKIVDIVGLRNLMDTKSSNGFAFSQDDGEALTQMQLINGFSDEEEVEEVYGLTELQQSVSVQEKD